MKRFFLSALLAALLMSPMAGQAEYREQSIDNDYQSEIQALAEDGKFLVLFFHQAGCPYCDKMRARVHPVPKVMEYFTDKFVMMESNIRGNLEIIMPDGTPGTEVDFAKKIRVRATPVFIFYDKDGTPALRTTGFLDADRFLLAGKYVAQGVHKTKTSFFRYLQQN
ncbi:MAG: thioredoxin fold domain-containing protein [Rhodospirillales bacterium]|nr:thioredoxin fold domain-containing protein [Rhodospirillales bacterium]